MNTTNQVITIKQLQAKLKPLGYMVKTKISNSGPCEMVHRISDNQELPSMFFSQTERQEWLPAIEAIEDTQGIRVVDDHGSPDRGMVLTFTD